MLFTAQCTLGPYCDPWLLPMEAAASPPLVPTPPPPHLPPLPRSVMAEHGYRAPTGWQGFRELPEK